MPLRRLSLEHRLYQAIQNAAWRGEVSLCREFGGGPTSEPVEDALYALVREKKIEWFGNNDRPLRYRVSS